MHPLRKALIALCALALSLIVADACALAVSPDDKDLDRSIRPGDDFYRFANGGWLGSVTVPAGRSTYDNRAILTETTGKRVSVLMQEAAGARAAKGSVTQKVGDYYVSFMDRDVIEAQGLSPVAGEMANISTITDKTSLSAYLGGTLNTESDGLTANADHVLGLWVNQGFADYQHNIPQFLQGGLGLPDRDSYLDESPKSAELRSQYKNHIAAILKLANVSDSDIRAARVLSLESKLARTHAPDSDAADVLKQNNPWKRAEFKSKAPGMDWQAYFKAAGLADQTDFLVWQPSAITGLAALVDSESIDAWKGYLTFHLIEHYAGVLPKSFGAEDFAFYGKLLSGAQEPPDKAQSAVAATNGALGQAVGQLYTQRYFPPAAKAQAQAMVDNLITAYKTRISNLTWMTPETKQKALTKLVALRVGVGYPDTWIDYSALDIVRGDAVGNMRRAEAFNRARYIAQMKQPANPDEWRIDPQTVGAVIVFSPNSEFFSAGILQPPYFDSEGDAASNYGSAGAGTAHEISHSFDELGNIYDAQGRLGKWWTDRDVTQYHAAGAKLESQLSAYCPLSGVCLDGKRILNESIADLAGLLVAHDAYLLSLNGKPDVVINGLTGEQRFFLAFSQRWRRLQDEAALRRQIATDTHPPGEYRSDTVRNVDAWYEAFGIAPGDKLYLKPEDRVRIW